MPSSWNGEFYANYGCREAGRSDPTRSWQEAVKYGFLSGGGGVWYSSILRTLESGDRLWVNLPGTGYAGVCRVIGPAQPFDRFNVNTPGGQRPALDILTSGHYIRDAVGDPDMCEYFVPVKWLQTVPATQALKEPGLAGYRLTVCRPRGGIWSHTVARLKQFFPDFDG
jgi:hypothetical protein